MLRIEALESVRDLAEIADNNGYLITAIPGSPLAHLNNAVCLVNTQNTEVSAGDVTATPTGPSCYDISSAASVPLLPGETASKHDMVLDNSVEVTAEAVIRHLNFAKSVAAPAIEELVTKTHASLEAVPVSEITLHEVVVDQTPEWLLNGNIEALYEKYSGKPVSDFVLNLDLPELSAEEVKVLVKTGSSRIDADLDIWLAAKGDAFILGIWNNVFRSSQNRPYDNLGQYLTSEDSALAVFLLAYKLFESPIEGSGLPLIAYQDRVGAIRDQAAGRLTYMVQYINNSVERGFLIKGFDRKNGIRNCVVYAAAYKKFIDQGGTNSMLFGNMLSERPAMRADEILSNNEKFLKDWERYMNLVRANDATRRAQRTRQFLREHFAWQLREDANQDPKALEEMKVVIARFEEMLAQANDSDIRDIWNLALKLVCRSRWPNHGAEFILTGINEAKAANPNCSVAEAAMISAIRYYADYVAAQFVVSKI